MIVLLSARFWRLLFCCLSLSVCFLCPSLVHNCLHSSIIYGGWLLEEVLLAGSRSPYSAPPFSVCSTLSRRFSLAPYMCSSDRTVFGSCVWLDVLAECNLTYSRSISLGSIRELILKLIDTEPVWAVTKWTFDSLTDPTIGRLVFYVCKMSDLKFYNVRLSHLK